MRLTLVSVLLLLTPGYAAASSGAASKNAENLAGHARPLQGNSLARPIRVVAQAISSRLPIGAASKSSIDNVVDSLFHLRQLSHVSISPQGSHVGWIESHEDPATGAAALSVYIADLRKACRPAPRITAGYGTAEHHDQEIVWSTDAAH